MSLMQFFLTEPGIRTGRCISKKPCFCRALTHNYYLILSRMLLRVLLGRMAAETLSGSGR
jgi:hypothetical protein